ncbi:hypothetical protein [Neobacillus dielmonensis]|uniref:hypothetical protein n=1 Tax=Neobacillus dielmonensis TaxID=1347369 RepID=UPI0006942C62|nr:hypothetical protein [Neobacillus dielmonensis]
MYPYGYNQPQNMQIDYHAYVPVDPYTSYIQPEQFDPNRQPQQLERRVAQLERANERQEREIERLQRRLQRVNQRLRAVERRFNFPFTPFDGEY